MTSLEPILAYGIVGTGYTDLTPGEERTVTTFESGLIRVEQLYTCPAAAVATARPTIAIGSAMPDGNSDPAVDGLYIYPTPQEREDGSITEFIISAYGRATTAFENWQPVIKTYLTGGIYYSVYEISGSIAVPRGASLTYEDLGIDPVYAEPFNFATQNLDYSIVSVIPSVPYPCNITNWDGTIITGQLINLTVTYDNGGGTGTVIVSYVTPAIVLNTSRNFGTFTELDITTRIAITGDGRTDRPSKS